MKRLTFVIAALAVTLISSQALATPVKIIEFSPNTGSAANWNYAGGILSFDEAAIDKALSSDDDTLVGAIVHIPTFQVAGSSGVYTLTPISGDISITNADSSVTYLTGSLGIGDLGTIGTVGGGYTSFAADVTNITITSQGQALASDTLTYLFGLSEAALDFELSLQGGSGSAYYTFADMIDTDATGSGGFSGAMSVPEPATICILGLGALGLIRRRRVNC